MTGCCRLERGTVAGWEALTLRNGLLRVTVLPGKGADIYELRDEARGVDVLFKAPWGLAPPGAPPREGSDGHAFLENYEGGWQELFPSAADPCVHRGIELPFHGEVAALPWEHELLEEGPERVRLGLSVRCARTPFRLERVMRLEAASRSLVLEERATNEGDAPFELVWGHHCVVGPPFLEAGCRLEAPVRTIVTIPEMYEESARLEPGQRTPWPYGRLRAGGTVDLREVPGREAGSHDDVYLTDLEAGEVAVLNPRLGLRFRLRFDADLFRWIISWQPYGGAHALPLRGAYALGIEPWVASGNLAQAYAAGEAITLAPGESLATIVQAEVEPVDQGAW